MLHYMHVIRDGRTDRIGRHDLLCEFMQKWCFFGVNILNRLYYIIHSHEIDRQKKGKKRIEKKKNRQIGGEKKNIYIKKIYKIYK